MSELKRQLGVHASIAGGIHLALERAKDLGCSTIQIFSHNPRIWEVRQIPEESALSFREMRKLYNITPVFIHASYLINLAAVNNEVREKSIKLLSQELDMADTLKADFVVLHTGSASQDTEEVGRTRAIAALKEAVDTKTWAARLLLKNTAGERGDITSGIKDLAEIVDRTGSPLIAGVCIDSCHAFQAGYDLSGPEGISRLAGEVEKYLAPKSVKLIHLNDSKKALNGRVDRHEHIGEGRIGAEGLKKFIKHPQFRDIPLILETPKKSEEDDPRNLKTVRDLLNVPRETWRQTCPAVFNSVRITSNGQDGCNSKSEGWGRQDNHCH